MTTAANTGTRIIHYTEDGRHCGDDFCVCDEHAAPPTIHFLDNDLTCTTKEGEILRLEDMSVGHRENVIRLLHQNAYKIVLGYWMHLYGSIFAPSGDMAVVLMERIEDASFEDPHGFVDDTRLVRRMRELNEKEQWW